MQTTGSSPVDVLLSRLDGVRQYGQGWRARCPAHGSDRNQSLSIAAADDGRVLLHCFAECAPLEILHSIGLELADLFEKQPERQAPRTPAERREQREAVRMRMIRRALPELALECRVVLAAAGLIERGEDLSTADHERLLVATGRIEQARESLR